jgi:uncharacterized protein YegP (UPF0339 family)
MSALVPLDPSPAVLPPVPLSKQPARVRSAAVDLCRFEIHREDEVMVTSTQFCGGDWQWQLCSSRGDVLAEAGGFGSERECREAITTLKDNASTATVTLCR